MVQPINYMSQIPQVDLAQSLTSGLQLGATFRQMQNQQIAQQQAQQAKQQFATDLQAAQADGSQKAWTGMIAKYPQFREAFGDVRKGVGEERLKNEFTQGFEISTALENNAPDVAKERVQTIIQAKRNAGEPTKIYEDIFTALDSGNIKGAQAGVNFALTALDPDRFEKTVKAVSSAAQAPAELRQKLAVADKAEYDAKTALATATNAPETAAAEAALKKAQAKSAEIKAQYAEKVEIAGLNKTNWDINNLRSQITDRSARLNLDAQKTVADVAAKMSDIQKNLNDIPADTRKLINESAVLSATSKQSAEQFNNLAKRLEESGGGYGAFSSASDFLKKGAGFQGGMTQLRQEYIRLRNTAAIKSLPPGPATDKDISLALKGFPGENASATDLSSFLRGMAKLQDVDASINNAKTDWLSQNNGVLTRAKSTFIAGDYATKPGETFNDFSQRIIGDVSKKYRPQEQITEEKRQQLVSQIPTGQAPTAAPATAPATAPVNIRSQADAILRGGQ
jgi:hypothetical protein